MSRAHPTRRVPWVALLAVMVGSGCESMDLPGGSGRATPADTVQVTRAVGEPINGLPTYQERTLHHHTNRVRCGKDCGDPSLICNGAPVRPLPWHENLGNAAHFHANHLHDVPCFQHQSCCTLVDNGGTIECDSAGYTCPGGSCDYNPDCPGTSASARVSMFGGPYAGENIAAGNYSPLATVCDQWYFSSGHHANMCNSGHGSMGTGSFHGSNCWDDFWVQNFGYGTPPAGIQSGSHWSEGGGTWFGAAFYHSGASGPPTQTDVVIDGLCTHMPLEYGDDEAATYAVDNDPGAGCHAYWFLFTGADSTRYAYPTTGSYLMGTGCGGEYTPDQAGAECEGGTQSCSNGETETCYDGPAPTRNVGLCTEGTRTCQNGTWGVCQGQVLPDTEACDGEDNDCNGTVDDPCDCSPGDTQDCGSDVGECTFGSQTCQGDGTWGACQGGQGPGEEVCDGLDNDCNGTPDNDCRPLDGGVPPADGAPPTGDGAPPTGDGAPPGPDARPNTDGGSSAGFDSLKGGCRCQTGPTGSLPALPLLLLFVLVRLSTRES